MILLIDNYDSFVHNLARYLRRLGQETLVVRNDSVTCDDIRRLAPQAIVLSPGPCTPHEAGGSIAIVREFYQQLPMLGVCLGHQAIAAALGARILRADEPMHGRVSRIEHDGRGLFAQLPSPLTVCRYHSLVVDEHSLPSELSVTARTPEGTIMAVAHAEFPLFGVQFHPEATLTEHGYELLANFLRLAGISTTASIEPLATEFRYAASLRSPVPQNPVTF